jgi:hypothetical protein
LFSIPVNKQKKENNLFVEYFFKLENETKNNDQSSFHLKLKIDHTIISEENEKISNIACITQEKITINKQKSNFIIGTIEKKRKTVYGSFVRSIPSLFLFVSLKNN